MAFDVIHKAAMLKYADLGTQGMHQYGGAYLPEAKPGTSYIPEATQRIQNIGNYLKTKAYDYGGNALRSLAKTVLPGKAYDFARDTWHEFHPESPVDKVMNYVDKNVLRSAPVKHTLKAILPEKAYNFLREQGRSGIKPTQRVTRWKDAIHADKYVNPDTVEELHYKPGSYEHAQAIMKSMQEKDPRWFARPERALKNIFLPEGDRLNQMALQEARSPRFAKQRYNGFSEQQIAQWILENEYKPALVTATDLPENQINQYTQVTPEQWNKWKDVLANGALSRYNADTRNQAFGKSEDAQDSLMQRFRNTVDTGWNAFDTKREKPSTDMDGYISYVPR